mgnify:CR=1 FL=1
MNLTVIVGRVGRAHGIRGDVSIDMATDEPKRRFAKGAKLRLADETHVEVASVRWHGSRLLVSFVGYPDRTAVERLTGQELWTTVRTARLTAVTATLESWHRSDRATGR